MDAQDEQSLNAVRMQQHPVAVLSQYVKDLSFENPSAPEVLAASHSPQIEIHLDLDAVQMEPRKFEVILKINAEAKSDERTVFILELSYGGVVQIADQVPHEQITPLAIIEGARQIFPFARSIVAIATRDGGFPPLLMNPVNFVAFYHQIAARHQLKLDDEVQKT